MGWLVDWRLEDCGGNTGVGIGNNELVDIVLVEVEVVDVEDKVDIALTCSSSQS